MREMHSYMKTFILYLPRTTNFNCQRFQIMSQHLLRLQQASKDIIKPTIANLLSRLDTQSTEVFYLDHGETANGPIEKVYVTTLVTPMGLASYFNGGILNIMAKK